MASTPPMSLPGLSAADVSSIAKTMGVSKVSNIDILHALQAMGIQLPAHVDTVGNQHGEFMQRLAQLGVPKDLFSQAEKLAGWNGNVDEIGNLVGGPNQLDEPAVLNAYRNYASLRQTGQLPPAPAPAPTPPVSLPPQATGNFALAPANPANQGPQPVSGVPGPAPAGPAVPGGVTMGTTKSRATPGVAAPSPAAPATPKPAPPANTPMGTDQAGAQVKALPANASDAQVEQYLKENYGKEAWVLGIPEIRDIVFQTLKNPSGVSQSIIDSQVQKTSWWQQNGQHVADFLQAQVSDSRGLGDKILSKQRLLDQKAAALGLTLSPEDNLAIATDWEKWQWDDSAVNNALSGQFHYQNNQHTVFTDKLMTDAKNYLVPIGDDTIQQWGQKIIANPNEEGNYQEFLKEQAKSMFPSFAARLDGGEDMKKIASPYASIAAQYLELDQNDVLANMTDPKWMTALDQVDDKGNHTSMSYADWTRKIKDDSVYQFDKTEQAKQNATGIATDLLRRFGAIA